MAKDKNTVLIEELSWTEIAESLEKGHDTVLIPCGAIEQHGPHLPTGVDTYLGYGIAEDVARALGDALVAPALRPGCSDHHLGFPGTISISRETFVSLLSDYCRSLAGNGFKTLCLIPFHGGNVDVMRTFSPVIARELQDDADVFFIQRDFATLREYCEENDIPIETAGVHAGYTETAEMLHYYPELVDMSKAEAGMTIPEFYDPDRVGISQLESFIHGIESQIVNGILGDARGASAEEGEEMKQIVVDGLVEDIRTRRESEPLSMENPESVANKYFE